MTFNQYRMIRYSDTQWKIERYNVVSRDWETLEDNYYSEADCSEEVRILNEESGPITL